MRRWTAALALSFALGCTSSDATTVGTETVCADAEARLGKRVCVHAIPDRALWESISFSARAVDQARTTKYLVPATEDAPLPPVFVDATGFEMPEDSLHFRFLTEVVEAFELLEYAQYVELILDPDLREFFAGSLTEYIAADAEPVLGFTVWDDGTGAGTTITCAQFRRVYEELSARIDAEDVGVAGELAVVPANDLQRETLATCELPIHDPSTTLDYERYTGGEGCGRLRRYTLAELAAAEQSAEFGFQDVLVVDQAPLDITTIIAGIVTGTRQGELSHLNVRSASRGTPNCYVADGHALLADFEGELVRLACGPDGATVVRITPAEAETCQQAARPDPVDIVAADLESPDLVDLLDLPTQSAEERIAGVARFGSKGANLATLYQRIDPGLQITGFLIPLHHHAAFMRDGTWEVDLGDGIATYSFEQTTDAWLGNAEFMSDGAVRRERLGALQMAIEAASCDPALLDDIGTHILSTQGQAEVMVRVRSSSNAEDALDFNGAGLYSSTSACLADETDGDTAGPSLCDADKSNERDLCRGLKRVWGSIWNMKAFEERAWYGIDHRAVGMGVLVDTRTKSERANIVAFSGNPFLRGDARYLINAQLGELDVVSAQPGVWPEKDLLTIEGGEVVAIERARGSTELPEGEWVLSDAQLEQLGSALATVAEVYPVDAEVPSSRNLMLDTEWKIDADGRLFIKQVRPFLD